MDIARIISQNLNAWMATTAGLGTIKQLAAKAQVGFGTVRRAKNGDGNITVQNLDAIAKAFGKSATDLISEFTYKRNEPSHSLIASEKIISLQTLEQDPESMRELIAIARGMSEEGRWQLVGQARLLANTYPAVKINLSS